MTSWSRAKILGEKIRGKIDVLGTLDLFVIFISRLSEFH